MLTTEARRRRERQNQGSKNNLCNTEERGSGVSKSVDRKIGDRRWRMFQCKTKINFSSPLPAFLRVARILGFNFSDFGNGGISGNGFKGVLWIYWRYYE